MSDDSNLLDVDLVNSVLVRLAHFDLYEVAIGEAELREFGTHILELPLHHISLKNEFIWL